MPRTYNKVMLVEDGDHLSVISSLIQKHIASPPAGIEYEVFIKRLKTVTAVLDYDRVYVEWQNPSLKHLALVVDADGDAASRIESIKGIAIKLGLQWNYVGSGPVMILADDGKIFGAWVMPNNDSPGMIETFCSEMVNTQDDILWKYASVSMKTARRLGADWKDTHKHRCQLYTWLSWKDVPGSPMGLAIARGILSETPVNVVRFVDWICEVFDVRRK